MGDILYDDNMVFQTDMRDWDLEASNGWTPDCSNKWDYDPAIISLSCRVWGPHTQLITNRSENGITIETPFVETVTWHGSVCCGGDDLLDSGFQTADSLEAAKKAVEDWAEEQAAFIRKVVEEALKK